MPSELNALPCDAVAVRRGDDVGAGLVDRRVEDERGAVDRPGAVDDVALVVDEDQVATRGCGGS